MLVDLHVYTSASGGPSLEQAVAHAQELGLSALAVADRHASAQSARRVAAGEFGEFPVFVGVELATAAGDVLVFVPELGPFLLREEWRELEVLGLPELSDVVDLAERHGGVVLGVHAYDRKRARAPRDRVFSLEALAGLEVWTSTSDALANSLALESGSRAPVGAFAGTASMSARPLRSQWATLFAKEIATQGELVTALRVGDFWPVDISDHRAPRPSSDDRGSRARSDRGERGDRGERSDRGGRGDRPDRGERSDRGGRGGDRDRRPRR